MGADSMLLLVSSPVGPLLVEYGAEGVRSVRFWRQGEHPPAGARDEPERGDALGWQIVREMREYFAGERREFTLPLGIEGTLFQQRVWSALREIPAGQTRTYAQLAEAVGNPRAVRAVGQANRANRLPILIPCHRVVAAAGGLGGYAGSGPAARLDVKRWLLRHEGATVPSLIADS